MPAINKRTNPCTKYESGVVESTDISRIRGTYVRGCDRPSLEQRAKEGGYKVEMLYALTRRGAGAPSKGDPLCCPAPGCRQYRLKDGVYCKKHSVGPNAIRGNRTLPKFYKRHLTKTLADRLDELTGGAPSEQLSLFEELALMREASGTAVALYGIAHDACAQQPENAKLQATLMAATAMMQESLSEVVRVCEAAARVDAHAKDKVSIYALHHFVDQIVRAAYDTFEGNVEQQVLDRFDELLKSRIKLPGGDGQGGTKSLPSDDVADMDASVPKSPKEQLRIASQ